MKAFIVLLVLCTTLVYADEYRHQVSFGTGGLGWTGTYEQMETKRESPFSDVDYFFHNISLNYAYRIDQRFQIGGFFQNHTTEYKFKTPNSSSRTEVHTQLYGLFGLYNFSDTISNSWFTGISAALYQRQEETSHNVALAESKTPFELDDSGEIYEVIVGKRFSLLHWKIDHLTYSPQISVYLKTHGKDFDDQDVKYGYGFTIQPIKFDVLF